MIAKQSITKLNWICPACSRRAARVSLRQRCQTFSVSARTHAGHNATSQGRDPARTRNIGIIAHIDAGKTTTTERMLYYSGYTRRIGDVDDGSTVTDFLPAERARGITIQSAAITFDWPPKPPEGEPQDLEQQVRNQLAPRSSLSHNINLIDTPGHADFTFEVRRSLRVLDGAICILDGVAGVEAQTEQVWKQAAQWQVPRIIYVNKLDRDGAAFARTVKEVGSRLDGWPAVCQIPWWDGGKGRFTGIGDVIKLQGLFYQQGGDGKTVNVLSLQELDQSDNELAAELRKARVALVELLSEHDHTMVEDFLDADEDHLAVSPMRVLSSLRRCFLDSEKSIIPVFAGASFRNIGVQPLLDAVVNLLPSPQERPDAEVRLGSVDSTLRTLLDRKAPVSPSIAATGSSKKPASSSSLTLAQSFEGCALAFKVVIDPRKGVLVYFRVYSGSIQRNAMLYNTNLHASERATNLLRMYASDSIPVQSVEAGQIGVFAGSKHARTGDTLIAYHGNKATPPEPLNALQLRPIEVPPPVFFASIEPNSLREEKDMHDKLALLLREDPSLHVTQDEDSGQTLLSGMGELHLEIARDRLVDDLKAKATMGTIEIGYRETILAKSASVTKIFDGEAGGNKGKAGCTATIESLEVGNEGQALRVPKDGNEHFLKQDGNIIIVRAPTLDHRGRPISCDDQALPSHLALSEVQVAFVNGALAALSRGPAHSYPVRNVILTLTLSPEDHLYGGDSTLSALSSAARFATIAALKDSVGNGGSVLMEPVMDVTISVDENSMGNVINDLSSSRGGHILSLDDDNSDSEDSSDVEKSLIDVRKIYAPPDPFGSTGTGSAEGTMEDTHRPRTIRAKVPLKEMVGYLKHLRSMTGGRATFVMSVDRFERMSGQREKQVLSQLRGA
jgi:elongation factor G